MRFVREIKDAELEEFVRITVEAYPGMEMHSPADRQRLLERFASAAGDGAFRLYGLFEDGDMLGVMRLYDFNMRLLSVDALVGGVGGVAVDLRHKKRRVAADMMRFFHDQYRERGACMTALYPFRPDFYQRMGYGYGTKMNGYRLRPATLRHARGTARVVALDAGDVPQMAEAYERLRARTNGLFARPPFVWHAFMHQDSLQSVGVKNGAGLEGYMLFQFERGEASNFLHNHLLVRELVYETPEALAALLSFLQRQADQVDRILLNTQDDSFHFLSSDARSGNERLLPRMVYHESNVQGVGIMYRVIDARRLFTLLQSHNFNGVSCRAKIELTDSFLPENSGSTIVAFEEGHPRLAAQDDCDVTIELGVADFSSLITGAVRFARLHQYGLVAVSDSRHVERLDILFAAPQPLCMTSF